MPKINTKQCVEIGAYVIMLLGSMAFGFMGRTAEMALAIVAGAIAFSLSNLDKFSKIKGAGFEAELKKKIETVIEKETEPVFSGETGDSALNVDKVDSNTTAVIDALQHPEYTWRYLGGITKDTGLTVEEVKKSIDWLTENGYVRKSLGKHGAIWNLTEGGRYLSAVIAFKDVKV